MEKVGTKQFKMQIVRPESSLFYKKVTWNIADRDDSNPDAAKYRYLGEVKDGKPHGVGMLYMAMDGGKFYARFMAVILKMDVMMAMGSYTQILEFLILKFRTPYIHI